MASGIGILVWLTLVSQICVIFPSFGFLICEVRILSDYRVVIGVTLRKA